MPRVSIRGVKSLGGHFACLCQGFEFSEVKFFLVIIFQKENGNTFNHLYVGKSSKREKQHKSTTMTPNLLE